MKKIFRYAALTVACLSALAVFTACGAADGGTDADGTEPETYSGLPEYDAENIENYVQPFEYVGLEVTADEGESRSDALWEAIVGSVQIIEYPEAQVEYYAAQERAKYRYYANRDGIEYDALLEGLGVTEESIYDEAKALVKDDLALAYVIKDAGIDLSDEEKQLHADRYAERLAEVYGYDAEYIKTNMTEQMHDAMLYDKTMEYLLLNNTVHAVINE